MSDNKYLVVYYSNSGNTKILAEAIAKELNCDIEPVHVTTKRTGFFGFLKTGKQSVFKNIVKLGQIKYAPANYDTVILGSPTYAGNMAPGIRSYIKEHKEEIKNIACFGTGADKKNDSVLEKIEEIVEKKAAAKLYLHQKVVKSDELIKHVKKFISDIL